MKMKLVSFILALLLFNFCCAEQKIAVVDLNEVFQKSSAGMALNDDAKQKQDSIKKEIEKIRDGFQDKKKKLEKQRGTLSKDSYQKKEQSLQNEMAESQKSITERTSKLENEYFEKLNKIHTTTNKIIAEYCQAKGIDLVIHNSQVVYKSQVILDITQDILSNLDKLMKAA